MNTKSALIVAGAALFTVWLVNRMGSGDGAFYRTTDTAGEAIRLYNRDGFIVDQRGRLWA